jgi:hypothetical protein
MSDNTTQVIGFSLLVVLVIFTAGTPDLLDAIIAYIGRH